MISEFNTIRRDRAELERNRVLVESMMEDAEVADLFDTLDSDMFESVTSEDIEALIAKLPESNDDDEQVEKILKSSDELGADEILGVKE